MDIGRNFNISKSLKHQISINVHFKKTVGNPHFFFQNHVAFQYNNNNQYHNFERNEDRSNCLLKMNRLQYLIISKNKYISIS